jgi:autotransporter-associated beta strand protein
MTLSGDLLWATNTADTLTRYATITAPISGSGGIKVVNKTDNYNNSSGITNGSLTLSNNNSFTGGVTIYGAVLKAGNTGALNSTNPNLVTFADSSPGYFNTNGFSIAVRGLKTGVTVGTPTVQNAHATAATLTFKPQSGDDYTYAYLIQNGTGGGALSLAIDGAGTQRLTFANTYTGNTTITAGTLLANNASGSATGAGNIAINGGTFGGTGTISGSVTLASGGTISPGTSIESLATGGNTWNGGGMFDFEFSTDGSSGTAGSQWDLLSIAGGLDLSGANSSNKVTLNLFTMSDATTPGSLGTWDANTDHTWAGFVTTTGITSFAADKFQFDTTGFQDTLNGTFSVVQNGNNLDLHYTAVPEPGTFAMLLFGSVMLWTVGRTRR